MRDHVSWERIIVHHSATPDGDAADFSAIRRYHTAPEPAGRGWREIGYHFVIERLHQDVVSIVGRSTLMAGAHCPTQNRRAIGVCVVGNYEETFVPADALNELVRLCTALCEAHGIEPAKITGHRDHKTTACPGRYLYASLPAVRARVTEALRA